MARYTNGAITFFTSREGLPPGAILNIHVDRAGRLWFASERGGLIRVDRPQAPLPDFVTYTTADGLSSNSLVIAPLFPAGLGSAEELDNSFFGAHLAIKKRS